MNDSASDLGGLTAEELRRLDAAWRASNYLAVAQIYLRENVLLTEPLTAEHVKPRLLGHWGTVPGLNLLAAHLNRVIRERDADVLYVAGPGHGGPALFAQTFLEGSLTALNPDLPTDASGMRTLCRRFSAPGGLPSHCGPDTPGSIHEGGELGYALVHAVGAALDNPDLTVACVIGDGEAETGALAASWQGGRFLNPRTDGAVLPVLHLNGYKIAGPAVLARIPPEELQAYLRGLGWEPTEVHADVGDDHDDVHRRLAAALDAAFDRIEAVRRDARADGAADPNAVRWPMLILRTPKGWTGPADVGGDRYEGTWRSHQVPLKHPKSDSEELQALERWLQSYRPGELFDEAGRPVHEVRESFPRRRRRMGLSVHANGGCRRGLDLPDVGEFAVTLSAPGAETAEAPRHLGAYLREVFRRNRPGPPSEVGPVDPGRFLLFGPDETASNRLADVFDATSRRWLLPTDPVADDHPDPAGGVFEILSEHLCEGWLEGYLLTGRHGLFASYEAFMPVVGSMVAQHGKWLKVAREVPWRRPVASLNVLLTSHVWRQDHNGFSHQDPGFVDQVLNRDPEIHRVFFPPDANTLLCVADECLRSRDRVNVIVAGKQPEPQWLAIEQAAEHVDAGVGIWDWAGTEDDGEPDVVMACCGDVPTQETLAAVTILREMCPGLSVRVVNVVDPARLRPKAECPAGLDDAAFDLLFTRDRPVVFAFHGYAGLIHKMIYRRKNHANFHVRGFREQGSTTTPLDMLVRNDLDRWHLAAKVAEHAPLSTGLASRVRAAMHAVILRHRRYVVEEGVDLPEANGWAWTPAR